MITLATVRFLPTVGRHQILAGATGVVDFGVMFLAVEALGLRPSLGALVGCVAGGIFNFTLSRRWVFHWGEQGRLGPQAVRYAIVSLISALLNAAGVEAGQQLGAPYALARAVAALAVSLGWNYPMHRRFVFAGDETRP